MAYPGVGELSGEEDISTLFVAVHQTRSMDDTDAIILASLAATMCQQNFHCSIYAPSSVQKAKTTEGGTVD